MLARDHVLERELHAAVIGIALTTAVKRIRIGKNESLPRGCGRQREHRTGAGALELESDDIARDALGSERRRKIETARRTAFDGVDPDVGAHPVEAAEWLVGADAQRAGLRPSVGAHPCRKLLGLVIERRVGERVGRDAALETRRDAAVADADPRIPIGVGSVGEHEIDSAQRRTDEVDHAARSARSIERRRAALDDFDPLDAGQRIRAEVDRPRRRTGDRDAVEQHQRLLAVRAANPVVGERTETVVVAQRRNPGDELERIGDRSRADGIELRARDHERRSRRTIDRLETAIGGLYARDLRGRRG